MFGLRLLTKKTGNTKAAYIIAQNYYHHIEDFPKAIAWYEIAHKKGNDNAAYALGLIYSDEYKDYNKALEWFKVAEKQGDRRAALAIAMTSEAQGDYDGAEKCYLLCVRKGDEKCINNISSFYQNIRNDRIKSTAYYIYFMRTTPKKEIIKILEDDLNISKDELNEAYKLHQTLDLPKHYTGGIDDE